MEFGGKRNHSPSGNFHSVEANLCFKNSKNSEIKSQASESLARDDEKGQSIFRILVPRDMVRHLGSTFPLKALEKYEDIKAQIKFIVGPRGARMVMVSAKEEPDSPLPPAVDGLLRVHRLFLDWLHDVCFPPIPPEGWVFTRLLVPAVQVSSLINSSTINSTEQVCSCNIKIYGAELTLVYSRQKEEQLPFRCSWKPTQTYLTESPALQGDLIVTVAGKSEDVHKAVESIASYLRKFLVDQSKIPTIEMQYHLLGKPPHHGISVYGREASMLARSSSNQSTQFVIIEEFHLRVEILRLYADAIIGIEGVNITCIRRLTGATFTVEEMQEVPDQIVVVIDGSCSQVLNAERLMLMFIAEVGGPQSTDSLYKARMSSMGSPVYYPLIKCRLAEQT